MSSVELQTIKNCAPTLEIIFKSPEREVIHDLLKQGFIKDSLHDNVLQPRSMMTEAEKAGMIVDGIKDAIAVDESRFHAFLSYLKTKGNYYSPAVKKLNDEFAKLGGIAPRPSHEGSSLQGGARNGAGRASATLVEGRHYGFLMEQLHPCQTAWERIAEGLRFQKHEIDGIRQTPMNVMRGHEGCMGDMLGQWFLWAAGDARGSEGRATLEALKTAVNKAGFGTVANSLTLTEPSREP